MRKIGLVAGLSYVSSLEYYRLINALVRSELGGHHSARIVLESLDEAEFLARQSSDPSEEQCARMIVDAVGTLIGSGAEVLALCANGIHRFEDAIRKSHQRTIVNIAEATARAVQEHGLKAVGVLGVKATMEGRLYTDHLERLGIEMVVPDDAQRELVHHRIVSELVLDDFREETRDEFVKVSRDLMDRGAEGVILGCTEIPLLMKRESLDGSPLFSTTEIHCRAIVRASLA